MITRLKDRAQLSIYSTRALFHYYFGVQINVYFLNFERKSGFKFRATISRDFTRSSNKHYFVTNEQNELTCKTLLKESRHTVITWRLQGDGRLAVAGGEGGYYNDI